MQTNHGILFLIRVMQNSIVVPAAIQDAPSPKDGMLQAQALKYLLRLWLKADPEEDAKKARWYLNRLINKLD